MKYQIPFEAATSEILRNGKGIRIEEKTMKMMMMMKDGEKIKKEKNDKEKQNPQVIVGFEYKLSAER